MVTENGSKEFEVATGLLVILSDALDDLEHVRIAADNRARALRDEKKMPKLAVKQEDLAQAISKMEHEAELELKRAMRAHPLGGWVDKTQGIGEKRMARLLGEIGNPAERETPSQLWAYCGLHVVDGARPRHKRGTQSNWNGKAKVRAWLLAESCVKLMGTGKQARSPYRDVYDKARKKWEDRETSDGHKHNHAVSVTAKAILLDLWRESRKLHGLPYNKNRSA